MTKKYDIIIIGSGMGGLSSAVILAKEGYKVGVLEKHNQIGGNLQTFVRDRTIFDTGVHYLGGLDKGQNLYRYFNYLGILEGLRVLRMDNSFDFITFDNDKQMYPHQQGYDAFQKQLIQIFPDEIEAIRKYCIKIKEVCSKFALYNIELGEPYDRETIGINAKEYLDSITQNEKLKAVLMGSNMLYAGNGKNTPFYVHALVVNSYIESAWRVLIGGSQISKGLMRQLRKYGGEVIKYAEVTDLQVENNRIVRAMTTNGKSYEADQFISNIDLNTTIRLVGTENFRKSYIKRIENLKTGCSTFTVHIAFKPESFPYLNYNVYHNKSIHSVWNATDYLPENWPESYMISMGVDTPNQQFAKGMSIMTYMRYEDVKKWEKTYNTVINENDRGDAYTKFKKEHIERVLDEVEKKYPYIRNCILSVDAATPLSFRDYIGAKNGNMYGFEKYADNPLLTFFSPRSKLKNLYLTGNNVNMHGILGVTIGAVSTCSEILGREYLIHKINQEVNETMQK